MKRLIVIILLAQSGFATAQDSLRRSACWEWTLSAGPSVTRADGSMRDVLDTLSRQTGTASPRQKNRLSVHGVFTIRRILSRGLFFESGIRVLGKRVNPEEGGYRRYKDSLNTVYCSIPLMLGQKLYLDRKQHLVYLVALGLSANLPLTNKAKKEPDRVRFSQQPVVFGVEGLIGFSYRIRPGVSLLLQVSGSIDRSAAYKETFYADQTNRTLYHGQYRYVAILPVAGVSFDFR